MKEDIEVFNNVIALLKEVNLEEDVYLQKKVILLERIQIVERLFTLIGENLL